VINSSAVFIRDEKEATPKLAVIFFIGSISDLEIAKRSLSAISYAFFIFVSGKIMANSSPPILAK